MFFVVFMRFKYNFDIGKGTSSQQKDLFLLEQRLSFCPVH
jgi:hypothetical protein